MRGREAERSGCGRSYELTEKRSKGKGCLNMGVLNSWD